MDHLISFIRFTSCGSLASSRGPISRRGLGLIAVSVLGGAFAACNPTTPPVTGSGGAVASGGVVGGGGEIASGGVVSSGGASGGSVGSGGDGSGGEALGGSTGSGGGANEPPSLLSETGLYMSDMTTLGTGVRPFEPGHQLWSDAAVKKRWIALPDGATIDTSDMDYWEYPTGTKLWKEFVRDNVRVETRLIEKREDGGWDMMAYQWREDQTEADAVPDGVMNASGTDHDIPNTDQCKECHTRMPDKTLGFSAIQLSHAPVGLGEGEWTLDQLVAEGRLSVPPPGSYIIPGDDVESDALGYLHANCGHCHQERSSVSSRVSMDLWLTTGSLATVEETSIYTSTVGVEAALAAEGAPEPFRIDPQNITDSAIYQRMNLRGVELAMPPVGSEDQDMDALTLLETWINSLPTTP